MRFISVIGHYFVWHYGRAISELTKIYRNLIAFTFNFFSVPTLVASYFAPWRRMGEDYPEKSVDLFDYFSVFLVNLIMRIVGLFMRTIVIILGMMATLLVIISYPLLLIFWIVLPFLVIITLAIGVGLLFK
jgi:hypothetical protein